MHRAARALFVLACIFGARGEESTALAWQIPEGVKSTQNPKDKPLPPQEALKRIELPDGFHVTLFAGEPDVAQPIAMTFDDRGRLWVAECYSYRRWDPEGKKGFDRILILEDVDNDGRFDKRTIFADNLANLSGLEVGFGGVWACCAPNLLFFPDKDRDDVPDGKAQVKLDGWIVGKVGHNIYNGLTWGPDGWLYGLHGIQDESLVGKPDTAEKDRVKMRCGVWRYQPVKETVEVVCHGTTNPWGLDFNEYGEGFFTNCVIGHLWHMIPGAHFKRMYGEDYNLHGYELIDQHADHLHWVGKKWGDSRGNKPEQDKAGGGHAHVGAMIYLADNWPAKYRQMVGMCNVHGQRLNFDRLERKGSGYVGRRGEDFFFANDAWFRGISVKYGPDGGVYISDWCDFGECHDNDGVHCTSGRIYKVVYGQVKSPPKNLNVATATIDQLLAWQSHQNAWYGRRARLELQRRAADGDDMQSLHKELGLLLSSGETVKKLRALWTLHITGGVSNEKLVAMLDHEDEAVRGWAVQLLCEDRDPPPDALKKFAIMAAKDAPPVRLKLASSLQRITLDDRWPIAAGLVSHEEDNEDHNLPLMIWYGIEPAVAADKTAALKLASASKLSKVRQFIAKRIAAASK